MASNSPGVDKLSGRATPEYKATQGMFDRLVEYCQYSLHVLSNKLLSNDLITRTEHGDLISKQQDYQASTSFANRMLWKIESDASYFQKFGTILREFDLNDAANGLEAAHRRILGQSMSTQSSMSHSSTTFSGIMQTSFTLESSDAPGSVCSSSTSQQAASDYFVAPVGPEQFDHPVLFDDSIQNQGNTDIYQPVSDNSSDLAPVHGQSSFMGASLKQSYHENVCPSLEGMPQRIMSQPVLGSSMAGVSAWSSGRQVRRTQYSSRSATAMSSLPTAGAEGRRMSIGSHHTAGAEAGSAPVPGSFNNRSNFHDSPHAFNGGRNRSQYRPSHIHFPLDRSDEGAATINTEPNSGPAPNSAYVGSYSSRPPSVHSFTSSPGYHSTPRYMEHNSAPTGVPPGDSHYSDFPPARRSSEAYSEGEIEFIVMSEAYYRENENKHLRHLLDERRKDVSHLKEVVRVQKAEIVQLRSENAMLQGYEVDVEALSWKLVRAREDSVFMYSKLLKEHMLLLNEKGKKNFSSQLRRSRSYSVELDQCARSPPISASLNNEDNSRVPVLDSLNDLVQRLQGLDLHMNSKSL